jgi:hypothetical protein
MTITSRAALVEAMAQRRVVPFYKIMNTAGTVGAGAGFMRFSSAWQWSGLPANPANPGAAATCDRTTAGALPIAAANTGNTWYLCGITASCAANTAQGQLLVFDRLAHIGGLVANSTSAQTVNLTLPSRVTDLKQVLIFVETYSTASSGTTNSTVSVSYTNELGVSGRTGTLTNGASNTSFSNQGIMSGPFTLQGNDLGVTSVESFTLGQANTTAGNLGITLARLVGQIGLGQVVASSTNRIGWSETGLVDVGASPCLMLAATNSPNYITGYLELCQG